MWIRNIRVRRETGRLNYRLRYLFCLETRNAVLLSEQIERSKVRNPFGCDIFV
jgi:hypothetical protein